jgi:hypothetical protein
MNKSSFNEEESYEAPATSEIAGRQNSTAALRLLLAQRRLYTRAKRWAFLRTIGISVIAVVAPILTAVSPRTSVVVGAVAAGWIFLARTLFVGREHRHSLSAAELQEQFDLLAFGMPNLALRDPHVTPEQISDLVGSDAEALSAAKAEHLLDWYPLNSTVAGNFSVAIAQRANAAYSERLQHASANVWLGITVAWSVIAVIVSLQLGLKFSEFLLGVAVPLLPALLDVYEQWRTTRSAGVERQAMAAGIEQRVRDHSVTGQDLVVWQDQMYGLRCRAPQVPELVYRRTRKKNELAMSAAAAELAAAAKTAPPGSAKAKGS